jgi:hypothetical protein
MATYTTLPKWIVPIKDRFNEFVVDPDVFYPAIFAELGVVETTAYWLEVAQGIMKLDFDMHVGLTGAPGRGRIVRYIRADNGRKERWNVTMHPRGQKEWAKLSLSERAQTIRKYYKQIRGFVPSG